MPEQAWAQAKAADALARDLGQPYSIAYVLAMTIRLHWWQRAWEQIPAVNAELARLSEEYGFALWSAIAQIWNGRIRVIQGDAQEGIRDMQGGIVALESLGNISTWPATVALLASAYGQIGQAEKGLTLLEDATQAMHATGELWEEAEIQRLKGELLLKQAGVWQAKDGVYTQGCLPASAAARASQKGSYSIADAEEGAERCFLQAMQIAHRQQAKVYELRASVDLSRLLQTKGKTREARPKLEKIHAWFTEGFDTLDYREATALLAELS